MLRLTHLEATTPLDRGGEISDNLTDFPSTNEALRAVKYTEEGHQYNADLTRHCVKPSVSTNTVLHRVWLSGKNPRRWIEVIFQVT